MQREHAFQGDRRKKTRERERRKRKGERVRAVECVVNDEGERSKDAREKRNMATDTYNHPLNTTGNQRRADG
jgi:hypothetical protein